MTVPTGNLDCLFVARDGYIRTLTEEVGAQNPHTSVFEQESSVTVSAGNLLYSHDEHETLLGEVSADQTHCTIFVQQRHVVVTTRHLLHKRSLFIYFEALLGHAQIKMQSLVVTRVFILIIQLLVYKRTPNQLPSPVFLEHDCFLPAAGHLLDFEGGVESGQVVEALFVAAEHGDRAVPVQHDGVSAATLHLLRFF